MKITALVACIIATFMVGSLLAIQETCNLRGGGDAVIQNDIVDFCPQWNGTYSCCTQASVKAYFEKEKMICNRKLDFVNGRCEKELRGYLCFSLCATDQDRGNLTTLDGKLRVCDQYAHDTYEMCRGKLHCPLVTTGGKNNTGARCHVDPTSTEGCYSIGQTFSDRILFTNTKIDKWFGLDLNGTETDYKPAQQYEFNVDVRDGPNTITCFNAAATHTYAVSAIVIIMIAAFITM